MDLKNDRILVAREPGPNGYRQVWSLGRGATLTMQALPGMEFPAEKLLG